MKWNNKMNINANFIKFDNEIQRFKNIAIRHNKFVKFINPEYSEIFKILKKFLQGFHGTPDPHNHRMVSRPG